MPVDVVHRVPSPWREILTPALLAPSPHNVQPWRIRILDDRRLEIHIEKRRTLPDEDIHGSFIILTMGVFIETIRLVAAHHQFELEEELLDSLDAFTAERLRARSETHFPFARLTLGDAPPVTAPYPLELLVARRTSRLPFTTEPIRDEHRQRLEAIAAQWGHRYHQLTGPEDIEQILTWNIEAVFSDLNHPPYRRELASWLRYTDAKARRERDGLDSRCMNQHPVELWFAFHLPNVLRWRWTRRWFAARYRAQIGPVTTLGFLAGAFWDPRAAYSTGRFLIHFWLELTRMGYFIHPYGNLVTHQATADRVRIRTGIEAIWLAFKIGRSAAPPVSQRRSLEEVLL